MTELRLDPVLPPWLIVILIGVGIGVVWLSLRRCALSRRRRALLLTIRLAVMLILGLLLLMPRLLRVRRETQPPALAVLVDNSASMLDAPGDHAEVRADNTAQILRSRQFRHEIGRAHV